MTALEQLTIWADASDDILIGVAFDDKPYTVQQMKASEALSGFSKPNVLIDDARVAELKGVTCVIVEGRIPKPSGAYRVIISSSETFA